MISVAEARAMIDAAVPPPSTEVLPLGRAVGRVLAEPLSAPFDLPRFTNSAMDGYALRSADVTGASAEQPVDLRVIGVSRAGAPLTASIDPGQCAQVMTGAAVPGGADAVVIVEQTSGFSDERVQIHSSAEPGQNIRAQGEEVHRGELVVPAGTSIQPLELGVLAGFGLAAVTVFRRAAVTICATGDELREPGQPLTAFEIYNSASAVLTSLCRLDAQIVGARTVRDASADLQQALAAALAQSDVVVVSGGVSMGRFDNVKDTVERLGLQRLLWGVAQKPGKPLLVATSDDNRKLVFGLPGNPVASLICSVEYVWPALQRWQGKKATPQLHGILTAAYPRDETKHRFLLGRAHLQPTGIAVTPATKQGSHMLTAGIDANCVCETPPGSGRLEPGESVAIRLLPWATLA